MGFANWLGANGERGRERARERERENARESENARARTRERGSAFAFTFICNHLLCKRMREWTTHLVYKRCRGGRVTVEL